MCALVRYILHWNSLRLDFSSSRVRMPGQRVQPVHVARLKLCVEQMQVQELFHPLPLDPPEHE